MKKIIVISIILLPFCFTSCERDPSIEKGNYLYENQTLTFINDFPVHWSDDNLSSEIKSTVWEILDNMVKVEGGTFSMGNNYPVCPDESPAHYVTLSDFYINKVTVTQKQWKTIMGGEHELWNARYGKGNSYPANFISYEQAISFIDKLNYYSGLHFRMPTEAEWECAALGGNQSYGFVFSGSDIANEVAWTRENAGAKMHVDLLNPNGLGLYNMSGNLWEWCSDYYGSYPSDMQLNPTGPASGDKHVLRGGSFTYDAEFARCKARNSLPPTNQSVAVGLRLVIEH